MKLTFMLLSFICVLDQHLPPSDLVDIAEAVESFANSVDAGDADKLKELLHDDYRSIVNQALGSDKIDFLDKATYLDLLAKGIIGGDQRTIVIQSIDLEGNNAVVKARLEGKKLVFTTFIQVVKNSAGQWQIMSDMPTIEVVSE